jgi:hypothetical protein
MMFATKNIVKSTKQIMSNITRIPKIHSYDSEICADISQPISAHNTNLINVCSIVLKYL